MTDGLVHTRTLYRAVPIATDSEKVDQKRCRTPFPLVVPGTFYPNLQVREELRNAMASEVVYRPGDDVPEFALKLLSPAELAGRGFPQSVIDLIGTPASVPGLKSAIYLDHISGKYVLAFAGTDDGPDIVANIWQGLGGFSVQYRAAITIGRGLINSPLQSSVVTTGHSLGGGLARGESKGTQLFLIDGWGGRLLACRVAHESFLQILVSICSIVP